MIEANGVFSFYKGVHDDDDDLDCLDRKNIVAMIPPLSSRSCVSVSSEIYRVLRIGLEKIPKARILAFHGELKVYAYLHMMSTYIRICRAR